MRTAEWVRDAIRAYVTQVGHRPRRVLWANDVRRAVIDEERRALRFQPKHDQAAIEGESSPIRFISDHRLPAGTLILDDREGDEV